MLDYHGPICPDLLMRKIEGEGPWEATAPDSTTPVPPSSDQSFPPPLSFSRASATITPRIITPQH